MIRATCIFLAACLLSCNFALAGVRESQDIKTFINLLLGPGRLDGLEDEFYSTSYGFKVHQSCVVALGADRIGSILKSSVLQGLTCQWSLGTSTSRLNAHKLVSVLNGLPVKLICTETNISDEYWGQGVPSSRTGDYPWIILNIKNIFERLGFKNGLNFFSYLTHPIKMDQLNEILTATLFHELVHTTGYFHGHDVDYPYACEACCFTNPGPKKDLGCKICKGTYDGADDPSYVTDAVEFFSLYRDYSLAYGVIRNYLELHPLDRWGRFKALEVVSRPEPGLAAASMAEQLDVFYKDQSPVEREVIKRAKDISKDPNHSYLPLFVPVAKSWIDYLEGQYIESERELLKVKIPPSSPETVQKGLEKSISNRAWALHDHYGFISLHEADPTKRHEAEENSIRIYEEFLRKK